MKKPNTRFMVTMGLLVALHVVLSRFCSINAWNLKIGFAFVPVFAAAFLYGPVPAGVVGAVGDLLGAVLFPIGPYFPGFTVTCFLTGIAFGLLLHKKQSLPRILIAVAISQLALGLLLNTLWISILYESPFGALLITRVVQCLILIPVECLVIGFMSKGLVPLRKVAAHEQNGNA